MPTDTWATRKRAEAEAMGWADAPIKKKDPIDAASGGDRMAQDVKIGHVEKQTKDNPYKYLGHFAGNDVVEEGHNTGIKPLGKAYGVSTDMAKAGYKIIPGSAAALVGKANYHGRHYGDELDRMENEAREVGLKEPKAVTSRKASVTAPATIMADGVPGNYGQLSSRSRAK
jgi:hypothetical protein